MKKRILLALTLCLAFGLLTGGQPTKRFGMGRPFGGMIPFGMVDECDANWNPTKISGCFLWLDAGMGITTSVTSTALCSIWTDQSGNGRSPTVAGLAREPGINSSALNGKPGLTFAGTGANADYMFIDWAAGQNVAEPMTIFIIAKDPVTIASATRTVAGESANFYPLGTTATTGYYTIRQVTTQVPSTTAIDSTFHKFKTVFAVGANADSLFVDGVNVVFGNGGSSAMAALYIGATSGPASFADMTICAVFGYSRTIAEGSADLAKINAYISKRWGL